MKRILFSLSSIFLLAGCLAWTAAVATILLLLLRDGAQADSRLAWWIALAPFLHVASLALHLRAERC